ncbi:unnamed protein product [Protopolystoma xenopodis]|uniref:IF rod domain-containing protein n=1 Tax=Protopolystoma xenopodis TaxID=117903 RepID=A0A448WIN0_9PLAT|nr:unnamed protein product [Protopolystoma xenopodis]
MYLFSLNLLKVRFLEAQNRKLANELNTLRDRWGKETERIKAMYEVEMEQLRRLLNAAEKAKAELELRINSMEDQLLDAQHL